MGQLFTMTVCAGSLTLHAEPSEADGKADSYTQRVREYLYLLMAHGTDSCGEVHIPVYICCPL